MDKDAIIEKQAAEIRALKETIARFQEEIARLKKDSSNSSKPPSSDIVKPKKTVVKVGRRKCKARRPAWTWPKVLLMFSTLIILVVIFSAPS